MKKLKKILKPNCLTSFFQPLIIQYLKTTSHFKVLLQILVSFFFLLFALIPSGCKNSYSKLLSYSVQNIPKNLDPQTACNPDEISTIANVFEGLYRKNPNNTFSLAAASNVQHNPEKTCFVFSIKNNRFWFLKSENKANKQKFEQPISAADFEFAFKRLLSPSSNSTFAQNYYFIKNAQAVHEGKLNIESLGVKAKNNNELSLELEHPVPNLEEMLAASPAMPCCEKFFVHTKGRYGLNIDTIMCNGYFYVHHWPQNQKDKKLRLRVNPKNPDSNNIKILGVNLSQRPQNEALKLVKKNELDSAFFDNNVEADLNSLNHNNNLIEFQNSTSGIIFNQKSELFQNEKIRQALALTINRKEIENNLNSKKAIIAQNIVPNSVTISGETFQKLKSSNSTCPEFDLEKAQELFTAGINELKPKTKKNKKNKKSNKENADLNLNLNKCSILVNKNNYNILNKILQNFQQNLNLYLKTDVCDDETYLNRLRNGNFDCALVTLENEFNSPSCLLSKFLPNSPFNFANVQIPNLKPLLDRATKAYSLEDMANFFELAEREILNSASFIPIFHPIKYFAYSKKFDNVHLIKSCKLLLFDSIVPKK